MVPGGITLWPTCVWVTAVQLAVKEMGAVFSSTCTSTLVQHISMYGEGKPSTKLYPLERIDGGRSCTQITGLDARPRKAEAIECSVLAVRRVKALQGWPLHQHTRCGSGADLEGEGEADGVEPQELNAVRHSPKVLGQRSGSLPQAVHQRVGRLEAEPVHSLERDGPAVCPRRTARSRRRAAPAPTMTQLVGRLQRGLSSL